jgi:NADPH:quinone reductase-like Zn-dependent oxidoreductase/NADP-dependent 3-hydroxy acid dehydrogenase YdfG
VEVEVAATGLNFMNVMSALGTYPGAPGGFRSLGIECAGRVSRVGPGVHRLAVGDEVLGLATDCLASHALTRAGFLTKKPAALSFATAAALPVAFLTAYHALHDLGRLEAGESILIHSAAGGLGLAALHLARRAGAEIYATAGSEEKHALLRSLGARQVMDSRSLDFADQVLAATGGRGVDVVLNSLAGPALRRSLALLAPCGRFVEIGKRDLYGGGRLDLALLRRGVSYFAVDLDLLTTERPALIERLLDRLAEQLAAGELIPPPVTEYPLSRMSEAFRFMAEGRHVGKIVLVPPAANAPEPLLEPEPGPSFLREASYLIAGGCGALGLTVAGWMLENGAGHVVLLGRSGASPEAAARIAELERRAGPMGGRLHVPRADVADEASLARALAEIERSLPPLRGVVHAAGVLADGPLLHLDPESCRKVLAPKVRGAWNLHRLTTGLDLDFFVLFSSAASLFGSAGQATYTAANAFLDGLAHYRRRRGQPALAVNWGPVARIGLAATPERGGRLAAEGLLSLTPEEVPSLLAAALGLGAAQVGAVHLGPALSHPLLSALAPAPGDGEASTAGSFRTRELLTAHLVEQVAKVLRCPASSIAVDTPWKSLGIDSLSAIQLAKRLGASLGLPLSVTGFWTYPTVEQYRDYLAEKLGIEVGSTPAPTVQPAGRDASDEAALEEIESLTDEDAERLLRQRLAAV